jgi:hypothetical protein
MTAADALLSASEVSGALGEHVRLLPGPRHAAIEPIGSILAAAANDVAYGAFSGQLVLATVERPIAVGEMILVFDSEEKAEQTFTSVAEAAHLRTSLGGSQVAVETTTVPSGLVSYWGYVFHRQSIAVLTLDTLDPHVLSMTTFRTLVTLAAGKLETADS